MTRFSMFNRYSLGVLFSLVLSSDARAFNDPATGRWITRDPIGYVDGMNLYEHLMSNPLAHVDYAGLQCPPTGTQPSGTNPPASPPSTQDKNDPCHAECIALARACVASENSSGPACTSCRHDCVKNCDDAKRIHKKANAMNTYTGGIASLWWQTSTCGPFTELRRYRPNGKPNPTSAGDAERHDKYNRAFLSCMLDCTGFGVIGLDDLAEEGDKAVGKELIKKGKKTLGKIIFFGGKKVIPGVGTAMDLYGAVDCYGHCSQVALKAAYGNGP